ncbi:MAG: hypothetical protein RL497_1749 [Pseudomonadota bacterium]|jgi:molybdopterin synthase sulfur carrier subunit
MYMAKPSRIVYFAALAQALGLREESVEHTAPITLEELKTQLIQRGPSWNALAGQHIKAAVNHQLANAETWVKPGDEVAFFPPVTGG